MRLHCLTSQGQSELRIVLPNKTKEYLSYCHFRVGPEPDDYQLSISGFSENSNIEQNQPCNIIKYSSTL